MKRFLLSLLIACATLLSAQAQVQIQIPITAMMAWGHGPYGENNLYSYMDDVYTADGQYYGYVRRYKADGRHPTAFGHIIVVYVAADGSSWCKDSHWRWQPYDSRPPCPY